MTVLKTRQQILNTGSKKDALLHQTSLKATFQDTISQSGYRGLFRGGGIVVSMAVPARVLYISVLESSRHESSEILTAVLSRRVADEERVKRLSPMVASIAGGVAGGLAALCVQMLVVPMDIISQKQMVMPVEQYKQGGSVKAIMRSILRNEGWVGLYKGFGLSIFSSLPTGSVWWATYGGCQHFMDSLLSHPDKNEKTMMALNKTIIQVTSGVTAALVASTISMPLDVVKTRLQVGDSALSTISSTSALGVARDLWATSGFRGFFRGLGPRVIYMSTWGTILSSFYELLRHVSVREDI